VGGIHHGVLFRRDDPHPAQGAAVVVCLDHDSAKALITGRRSVVVRFDYLLYQRQVGFFFQNPAVVERLKIKIRTRIKPDRFGLNSDQNLFRPNQIVIRFYPKLSV
jgi:hypothetical protein